MKDEPKSQSAKGVWLDNNKVTEAMKNYLDGPFQDNLKTNKGVDKPKKISGEWQRPAPLIIGVVTPHRFLLDRWKRDIGDKKYGNYAEYKQIKCIDDIRGCVFYKVEKGYYWQTVGEHTYTAALQRVKQI